MIDLQWRSSYIIFLKKTTLFMCLIQSKRTLKTLMYKFLWNWLTLWIQTIWNFTYCIRCFILLLYHTTFIMKITEIRTSIICHSLILSLWLTSWTAVCSDWLWSLMSWRRKMKKVWHDLQDLKEETDSLYYFNIKSLWCSDDQMLHLMTES